MQNFLNSKAFIFITLQDTLYFIVLVLEMNRTAEQPKLAESFN